MHPGVPVLRPARLHGIIIAIGDSYRKNPYAAARVRKLKIIPTTATPAAVSAHPAR